MITAHVTAAILFSLTVHARQKDGSLSPTYLSNEGDSVS